MADSYASHFTAANIPYGIASSTKRPNPQVATRISSSVIFLAELTTTAKFPSIPTSIFQSTTLNPLAALPKPLLAELRTAIQNAYASNVHTPYSEDVKDVTLHMPVAIGDFTDYSASVSHVLNASEAVTGTRAMPPAYLKYPAGYAGRCSSITTSPTHVTRPLGQFIEDYSAPEKNIMFGPCRALDYELEVGAIIGAPVEPGSYLAAKDADAHIFGFVLVNDWSARDVQGLEMNPLGPFNGKNFRTSISPWVITLEALAPSQTRAPPRMGPVADFMHDDDAPNYDIRLTGEITRKRVTTTTCSVGFDTMYWTFRHMLAHHVVGGCGLRTGDLVASGTVSGEAESEHGCLLELTMNGRKPSKLSDGSELRYLEDGDEVRYVGVVGDGSKGVGFGECAGVIGPARKV
jgi:fumarylacetoacetase